MPTPITTKTTPKRKRKIPDHLVYEVMDNKPIYYKGYQSVLNKTKTLEDIIGCSSLQAALVTYLLRIIFRVFDEKKYHVLTNEIGSHIDKNNNLSNDIAIYDKAVLTPDKINKKYPDVPPKIAIEIDTEADTSELTGFGYTYKKSKKLLDFGVERVIWIMINTKTVTVIEPNRDWQVREWNTDIELMDGHTFNIARYLDDEGIVVED
ncbi:Uma2 family endonuclease [Spirosoma litoris]